MAFGGVEVTAFFKESLRPVMNKYVGHFYTDEVALTLASGALGVTAEAFGDSFRSGAEQGTAYAAAGFVTEAAIWAAETEVYYNRPTASLEVGLASAVIVTDVAAVISWTEMSWWQKVKYYAGAFNKETLSDGVRVAVLHNKATIAKYGTYGRVGSGLGWFGEAALVAAGGAAVWQATGGATMDIAVSAHGAGHVAYGTGGQWLHGVGLVKPFVTSHYAAQFAAGATQLTGIPVLSSEAILATAGASVANCGSAAMGAYVSSGGLALTAGGAVAVGGATTAGVLRDGR